jgi:hypothetical protein
MIQVEGITDVCDNTDCPHGNDEQTVFYVEMLDVYEGGIFLWCRECIERDGNMIEDVHNPDEVDQCSV